MSADSTTPDPVNLPPQNRWLIASAPSKVNLILNCAAPSEMGGYHALFTVFQALNLRETVCLRRREDQQLVLTQQAQSPSGEPIELDPELAALNPQSHLAYRAVNSVLNYAGITAGADIHVIKRVPVAGGMAGGSADAAAALLAADALFNTGLNDSGDLEILASRLGADVPFCLLGGLAVGTGRGDELTALPAGPRRTWVLVTNQRGLSTPGVFAQADHRHALGLEKMADLVRAEGDISAALDISRNFMLPQSVPSELTPQQLRALTDDSDSDQAWQSFLQVLHNDLQVPALDLRPDLADIIRSAEGVKRPDGTVVPTCPIISGSGPTVAIPVRCAADAALVTQAVSACPGVNQVLTLASSAQGARIEGTGPLPGGKE